MSPRKNDDSQVYQLKVTLKWSKPPIWRRIQVRGSMTLYKLHQVLQVTMGWFDEHLHQFIIMGHYFGDRSLNEWDDRLLSERIRLDKVIPGEKFKFVYEYDFGDGWEHEILVEKILPPDPAVRYPICLTGRRACPPEDIGGIWGYAGFLEAIGDPNHPRHDEYKEWIGVEFDPVAFDLDAVNADLRRI